MCLRELWSHQKQAVENTKLRNAYGLFFEMGCGKSAAAVHILRQKCNQDKRALRTLIVTPLITLHNWVNEIEINSKFTKKDIAILAGSEKDRLSIFAQDKKIFLVNYEALVVMPKLMEAIFKWAPELLIFDESHKIKDIKSKRTKMAAKLADQAKYKLILTGSPVLNSPMDLFGQFRVLLGGFPSGYGVDKNFFNFRARFFYDKNANMNKQNYFPDWQIKPGALKELNKIVAMHSMRVTKEDVLDLPEFVEQNVYVEMLPEQRRHYNEMREEFITFIGDKACVADLAIVKALRLQQIVSGYIPTSKDSINKFKSTPRQIALRELLEELVPNHKVIVWATFKENYAQIIQVCNELEIKYVEVHGEINNTEKFNNVDAFSNDPSVRVFIGHPGSGGIGINLTCATYNISFSRNFSLEHFLQSRSRSHRGGQTQKVTWINLVTKDTIDEIILKALDSKEEMGDKLLSKIKSGMGISEKNKADQGQILLS